jgi:putative hydroxymethylpyrimidine transport system substrate-binding protein
LKRLPAARRIALLAVAIAGAALAVSACGSKSDVTSPGAARPFNLMLDFFPNADHAAIYAAIANGDFRAAGLDVRPQTPSDPSAPLKLLAAGRVDMAISYEPEVLLARDQGLRVVSIAALVQRPLTSVIAIAGHHVARVADLAGKKVGTAGIPYQSAELKTVLTAAGVNSAGVQEINVGFDLVPAMLSGKVAATLGGFWNYEGVQLALQRKRPVVIPVDQAGVPTYDELVLVVRDNEARTRGEDLRGFLQALTRGQQRVSANPAAAADLVVKANADLDRRLQLESIKRTLPATRPADSTKPYGYQDPNAWAAFRTWMYSHSLLQHATEPSPPFTNEFLPGQGV